MEKSAKFIWAALYPADNEREIVAFQRSELDWEYIRHVLFSRKIAQLFYSELERRGRLGSVPEGLAAELREMYQRVAAKNLMLFHDLSELFGVLNQQGIRCIVMKGGALVIERIFRLGERILADIDLLVRPEDFNRVRDLAIKELNYSELKLSDPEPWQELHIVNSNNSHLEVHAGFRPMNGVPPEAVMKRFWSRAREVEYRRRKVMLPACEDILLQDAVHAGMHHLFDPEYLFPAVSDISRIMERWSEELDWPMLLEFSGRERAREHMLFMILLSERIFPGSKLTGAREEIDKVLPGWAEPLEPLVGSMLDIMMQRESFSLDFMVYFLARATLREKLAAIRKAVMARREKRYIEVDNRTFSFPRPTSGEVLVTRLKKFRVRYMRFFYLMARFYRSINYLPP